MEKGGGGEKGKTADDVARRSSRYWETYSSSTVITSRPRSPEEWGGKKGEKRKEVLTALFQRASLLILSPTL